MLVILRVKQTVNICLRTYVWLRVQFEPRTRVSTHQEYAERAPTRSSTRHSGPSIVFRILCLTPSGLAEAHPFLPVGYISYHTHDIRSRLTSGHVFFYSCNILVQRTFSVLLEPCLATTHILEQVINNFRFSVELQDCPANLLFCWSLAQYDNAYGECNILNGFSSHHTTTCCKVCMIDV